jgi:hypothetical protein
LVNTCGEFTAGMVRAAGGFDVVHAHHWLSGVVGAAL